VTAPETVAHYAELFAGLGAITTRNMMGGTVFYADGRLFATIHGDGQLYLRSKGALAAELAAAGESQLTWTRPSDGQVQRMGYWALPDSAEHDATAACALARRALAEN
jgi:DNA transformation protein